MEKQLKIQGYAFYRGTPSTSGRRRKELNSFLKYVLLLKATSQSSFKVSGQLASSVISTYSSALLLTLVQFNSFSKYI